MSLFVQKFGGTSVASVERIEHVAARIIRTRNAGHDVVVVVSAMALASCGDAGQTCTLMGCAYDGLRIDLVPAGGGDLAEASYVVTVRQGVIESTCTFSVPEGEMPPGCRSLATILDSDVIVDDAFVTGDATFHVTVDGVVVVDDVTQAITIESSRPNGEGCEPVCRQGSATVAIP